MSAVAPDWDLICVGSGITGLSFACEVQRLHPGLRVLVLEKHNVAGGYASEFQRPKLGARFDCSLHKLSGMGPQGNLRRTLQAMGIEGELDIHMEEVLFEASLPDRRIVVPTDPVRAQEVLARAFPAEAAGLAAYFEEVATHGRDLYMQFQTVLGEYQPDTARLRHAHRTLKQLDIFEGLRRHVSDPQLIEILSMPVVYVGGFPEQIGYLYFLHVAYACQFMGCAYVTGGAQHLTDVLVGRIRRNGGEVLLGARVQSLELDAARQRVVAVRTTQGRFGAAHVALNAAPHHVVDDLLAGYPELAEARSALASLQPSNATTTAYLVLDRPARELGLAFNETMLMPADADRRAARREAARALPSNEALAEAVYWQDSTIEVTDYGSLDPARGPVVVINMLDDIRQWPQRKTDAYRAKKLRAADVLCERLYRHAPGLRGHVTYVEVSSPRTCLRYTNNTAGSGYGALIGPRATGHGFHHRFPLSNVSFMSAWVAGSGYEAGMGFAAMKARGFRHLFQPAAASPTTCEATA